MLIAAGPMHHKLAHSRCCLQVLQLHLDLLLGPDGLLDLSLVQHGPANALFPLWRHLSCASNEAVLQPLQAWAAGRGPHYSRLLRLLSPTLFDRERYALQGVLARGGSAVVRMLAVHADDRHYHRARASSIQLHQAAPAWLPTLS